jgi:hypothetical protein
MNLIKKIKNIFTKKKNIDYNKDYWFPTYQNPIVRKIKINKIYKKNKSIDTSFIYHTHYNFVSHPIKKKFIIPVGNISGSYSIAIGSNNITSGYNNTAYGYSSFPNPINKIRIKKLNKIYGRDHEV